MNMPAVEMPLVRQRAREASDAAQRWVDIETALTTVTTERDEARNKLSSIEQTSAILTADNERLRAKNESLTVENALIMEGVRHAAITIRDIYDRQRKGTPEEYAPSPELAQLSQVTDDGAERIAQTFKPRT